MIRTLIDRFFPSSNDVPYQEHLKLKVEHESLKMQLAEAKKQLMFLQTSHKDIPLAGFDDLNIEPVKTKDRAQYISDVTIFFNNIFHRKLKVSIAEVRELLSNIGRQEGTPLNMSRVEYDFFLRGMEAMAWKIIEWAQTLEAEGLQDLQDNEN